MEITLETRNGMTYRLVSKHGNQTELYQGQLLLGIVVKASKPITIGNKLQLTYFDPRKKENYYLLSSPVTHIAIVP